MGAICSNNADTFTGGPPQQKCMVEKTTCIVVNNYTPPKQSLLAVKQAVSSEKHESQNKKEIKTVSDIKDLYNFNRNSKIGEGSYGSVYIGKPTPNSELYTSLKNQKVAIKTVKKSDLTTGLDKRLMKQELEILQACSHPGIMKVYEVLEDRQYYYIVSEVLEGGELYKRVCKKVFKEEEAKVIIRQIVQALIFLHGDMKVAHRDLKSENILLASQRPGDLTVKLVDFGFAAYVDPKNELNDYLGSPIFLAPEVFQGKTYNEKVDIWSLGVIVYELLSGGDPFEADNVQALKRKVCAGKFSFTKYRQFKNVSEEVKDFIRCCLVQDSQKRYSAEQLLAHPWLNDGQTTSTSNEEEKCSMKKQINIEIESLYDKTTQAQTQADKYEKEAIVDVEISKINTIQDNLLRQSSNISSPTTLKLPKKQFKISSSQNLNKCEDLD